MKIRSLRLLTLSLAGLIAGCQIAPVGYGNAGYTSQEPTCRGPGYGTSTVTGTAVGTAAGGLLARDAGGRRNRNTRTVLGALGGGVVGAVVGSAFEPTYPCPTNGYAGYGGYDGNQEVVYHASPSYGRSYDRNYDEMRKYGY